MEKVKLYELIEKPLSGVWGDEDIDGNGIPVLRTTNFTNNGSLSYSDVVTREIVSNSLKDKYLRVGDILIEKSGGSDKQPVGRVVYFEGEENKYLFNNFTSILRVKNLETCFPKYLFYGLFSNYQQGGTRPYENKTTGLHNLKLEQYINSFEIPLPSLEEQKAIAGKLDKVSGLIEKRKTQLEKLDLLIKSRFVELFGHQSHNEKNMPYGKIDDVAEIYLGLTHTPTYVEKGVKFISAKNTSCDYLDLSDVKYISREEFEKAPKGTKPQIGDVLFSRVGSNLGHPVILDVDEELCTFVSLGFLRTKGQVTNVYLKHWMRDDFFAEQVAQKVVGGGQPNLNTGWLKEFKIIIPPMALQNEFTTFVEQTDKSKLEIQKSLEKLEILKKSLMQQYFG